MKFKKVIFTSMAAVSLGAIVSPAISSPQNTVNAATTTKTLTKNAFIYNIKGKRVKSFKLTKGKKIKILGIKTINGKKYYRIGKNKYVKVANFKTISKPINPEVDTAPVPDTNTNNNISPTPTVPNVPQQQPVTPPVNNNGGSSNTDKPVTPPTNNNSNTDSSSTTKPTEPTKPTNTPASQAEKDALIAYLKQINSITDVSNPDHEKYEMSSAKDKDKFLDAVDHAHMIAKDKNSTSEDIKSAKAAAEEAYNKLDGQRYLLPCSQADFVHGRYTLTDADKTAILALANKVEGSTDAQFVSPTNQNIKYTHNDLYPDTMRTGFYLKFAKQ
jgi:hypothetical protein